MILAKALGKVAGQHLENMVELGKKMGEAASNASTMASLKNAPSIRSSIVVLGKALRPCSMQQIMNASAPLESWTLPLRWCTAST